MSPARPLDEEVGMAASAQKASTKIALGSKRASSRRQAPPPTLDNRQLLAALRAFRKGVFSVRLPRDFAGVDGELA
jgi:hypothetical protein